MYKAYSGTALCAAVFYLRNRISMEKEPGHSKQCQSRGTPSYLTRYFHRNLVHLHGRRPRKRVHTVEMTVPKPPEISNDRRACV